MPSPSPISIRSLIFVSLLLLSETRFSVARFRRAMLKCQANCFISEKKELTCTSGRLPSSARPVGCISTPMRHGVKISIGDFETASNIAPGGLTQLSVGLSTPIFLRLRIKFKKIHIEPLSDLTALRNLTIYRSGKNTIDSCLFQDTEFTSRLHFIQVECMGMGLELHEPFDLVFPSLKKPPIIQLRNCGVRTKCYRCQGDYDGVVWFRAKQFHRLSRIQQKELDNCRSERQCPLNVIQSCSKIYPITSTTTSTTTTTTTTSTTTSTTTTMEPSTPAAPILLKSTNSPKFSVRTAVGRATKTRQHERYESDGPNLSQMVNDLSIRTDRTQRFLIVILIMSVINSIVLVALLLYFCRNRLCRRKNGGRGVYVIAKSTDHPQLETEKGKGV